MRATWRAQCVEHIAQIRRRLATPAGHRRQELLDEPPLLVRQISRVALRWLLKSSHGHWKAITLVAGLRRTGMVVPMVLDGSINRDAFIAYVRQPRAASSWQRATKAGSASSGACALKRSFGLRPNLNDLTAALIGACIAESIDTQIRIVGALATLDLTAAHVVSVLRHGDGDDPAHNLRRPEARGRYALLDREGATS